MMGMGDTAKYIMSLGHTIAYKNSGKQREENNKTLSDKLGDRRLRRQLGLQRGKKNMRKQRKAMR
jgi:hypothetical protein